MTLKCPTSRRLRRRLVSRRLNARPVGLCQPTPSRRHPRSNACSARNLRGVPAVAHRNEIDDAQTGRGAAGRQWHDVFTEIASASSSPSMMTRSHFRGGGTSVASTLASMRSIREARSFRHHASAAPQRTSLPTRSTRLAAERTIREQSPRILHGSSARVYVMFCRLLLATADKSLKNGGRCRD